MKQISLTFLVNMFILNNVLAQNSDLPNLSHGKIDRYENFNSKFVTSRNVDVWLPDGYSDKEKYAVLYMHDGQMLFDSTKTWNKQEWGVDEIVSDLMDKNQIRKVIVVAVWNPGEERHSDYFPQKPFESLDKKLQDSLMNEAKRYESAALFVHQVNSDNYLKFLVHELKPFIDTTFSVKTDMANTFIAGSSMGGLISMYALCEYPEIFGGAACLSTHWIGTFTAENNPVPLAFANYMAQNLPNVNQHKFYFDYGTETLDAFYEPFQLAIDKVFAANGWNDQHYKSLKFEGQNHSEIAWRSRLHIPLKFLLKE